MTDTVFLLWATYPASPRPVLLNVYRTFAAAERDRDYLRLMRADDPYPTRIYTIAPNRVVD